LNYFLGQDISIIKITIMADVTTMTYEAIVKESVALQGFNELTGVRAKELVVERMKRIYNYMYYEPSSVSSPTTWAPVWRNCGTEDIDDMKSSSDAMVEFWGEEEILQINEDTLKSLHQTQEHASFAPPPRKKKKQKVTFG